MHAAARGRGDERPQAHALGRAGDGAERHPRVGDLAHRRRVADVVPQEDAVPAPLLGARGEGGHAPRVGQRPERREVDPALHHRTGRVASGNTSAITWTRSARSTSVPAGSVRRTRRTSPRAVDLRTGQARVVERERPAAAPTPAGATPDGRGAAGRGRARSAARRSISPARSAVGRRSVTAPDAHAARAAVGRAARVVAVGQEGAAGGQRAGLVAQADRVERGAVDRDVAARDLDEQPGPGPACAGLGPGARAARSGASGPRRS